MYASLSINNYTQDSRYSAQVILGARSVYVGIKQLLGDFMAYTAAHIVGIPFIFLIKYMRYRIVRQFPSNLQIDSNNYADIRKNYDEMSGIVTKLKPLCTVQVIDAPFVIRLMIRQIQKLILDMEKTNNSVLTALSKLDNIPNQEPPRIFDQIKESDLWAKRPKIYEYRV